MPSVTRQGDQCSGHDQYGPRPSIEGSPDVTINGMPVVRIGDAWAPHGHESGPPETLSEGSTTVFVNGQGIGRIGDSLTCPSVVAAGSEDVFNSDSPPSVQITGGEFSYTDDFANSARAAKQIVRQAGVNAPFDTPDEMTTKMTTIQTEPYPIEPPSALPTEQITLSDEPVEQLDGTCPVIENPDDPYSIEIGNFGLTVRSLTLGAVFKHPVQAQVGLSVEELICNMHHLCLNVVDPLLRQYPELSINSGFRRGSGASQHFKGMAIDLQSIGSGPDYYKGVLEFIAANIPYDQCILETSGKVNPDGSPAYWIHISYDRNKSSQRKERMTYVSGRVPEYSSGWAV